eukprot:GHRR01036153.1.p1 GENE.GHRR01036153.1~~GHRR01036153.1.p1  ORF type:complete len:114 (-),score=21.12 GHRR01036153.1:240-581(-)
MQAPSCPEITTCRALHCWSVVLCNLCCADRCPQSDVLLLTLPAGEPHFVAKPDAVAEDAGVVLSQCVDETGSGFLLVLDAFTWTELACAQLPYGIPYRFHGVWLAKHTARHAA